jgi:hypothetical protein
MKKPVEFFRVPGCLGDLPDCARVVIGCSVEEVKVEDEENEDEEEEGEEEEEKG